MYRFLSLWQSSLVRTATTPCPEVAFLFSSCDFTTRGTLHMHDWWHFVQIHIRTHDKTSAEHFNETGHFVPIYIETNCPVSLKGSADVNPFGLCDYWSERNNALFPLASTVQRKPVCRLSLALCKLGMTLSYSIRTTLRKPPLIVFS